MKNIKVIIMLLAVVMTAGCTKEKEPSKTAVYTRNEEVHVAYVEARSEIVYVNDEILQHIYTHNVQSFTETYFESLVASLKQVQNTVSDNGIHVEAEIDEEAKQIKLILKIVFSELEDKGSLESVVSLQMMQGIDYDSAQNTFSNYENAGYIPTSKE